MKKLPTDMYPPGVNGADGETYPAGLYKTTPVLTLIDRR